jgi:type II secretory pathway component PulJ
MILPETQALADVIREHIARTRYLESMVEVMAKALVDAHAKIGEQDQELAHRQRIIDEQEMQLLFARTGQKPEPWDTSLMVD